MCSRPHRGRGTCGRRELTHLCRPKCGAPSPSRPCAACNTDAASPGSPLQTRGAGRRTPPDPARPSHARRGARPHQQQVVRRRGQPLERAGQAGAQAAGRRLGRRPQRRQRRRGRRRRRGRARRRRIGCAALRGGGRAGRRRRQRGRERARIGYRQHLDGAAAKREREQAQPARRRRSGPAAASAGTRRAWLSPQARRARRRRHGGAAALEHGRPADVAVLWEGVAARVGRAQVAPVRGRASTGGRGGGAHAPPTAAGRRAGAPGRGRAWAGSRRRPAAPPRRWGTTWRPTPGRRLQAPRPAPPPAGCHGEPGRRARRAAAPPTAAAARARPRAARSRCARGPLGARPPAARGRALALVRSAWPCAPSPPPPAASGRAPGPGRSPTLRPCTCPACSTQACCTQALQCSPGCW